jgi:CBS domain-containing protein
LLLLASGTKRRTQIQGGVHHGDSPRPDDKGRSTETLVDAARKMRDLNHGALPICGEDQRLKGMLTDRDIVVKCIAEGKDPNSVTAGDLGQGKPVTIGADDSAEETLRTMAKYQVRRLPVIDGHQLVGIVAQADVARALPNDVVGQVLEEVSEK